MDRRSVIKNLVLFSGAVVLLPSCITEEKKASIRLENLAVSEGQERVLAEVAETILPATDTAGAKELGLHLFVLKMLDDCHNKQDQKAFMTGLAQFEEMVKKQYGSAFPDCSLEQRQEAIAALNNKKAPQDVLTFYSIMKNETIKGYLNSELVMTKLRVYELIPGRYDGYYPVSKTLVS
ncbi:gluconate 2-dehydrogenase subunit 3 family protein [Pontibacter qinzhouensis]|uniref:Gluconate 2-dehydrogenase subunit 3 family protein n=1 Tax=Pontibacter qinzhouensis TaxID=2603253 RepID=A0A5C8K8Q2_9BACT|nr:MULTISPECIES: gluconate 2-dehydrogenase subunit 3 family protein [Pontibacter]TXK45730.1 gluconate 2-dehydrogenase subunit 3 family protein [Pontibacter qinzhouensis]